MPSAATDKSATLRPTFSTGLEKLMEAMKEDSAQPSVAVGAVGGDGPGAVIPDFLYIGSATHALSEPLLESLRISHVLTITSAKEFGSPLDDRVRLHLQVRDTLDDKISVVFPDASSFISAAQEASGRCLVHCIEGRSRSCTLILAYLMEKERRSLAQAWEQLLAVRPEAFPNYNFWEQLHEYEHSLFGIRSELPPYISRWLSSCGAKVATPQSAYKVWLASCLNDSSRGKQSALAAWSKDWTRDEVMELLDSSFNTLPTIARKAAVDMLEELCKSKRLALEEAVQGIAGFFEDEELAAEMKLDVPQYDEFRTETLAAAKRAGLAIRLIDAVSPERTSSSPRQLQRTTAVHPNDGRADSKQDLLRTSTAPPPALDRDYFAFPDGQTWSLPVTWMCREKVAAWRRHPTFKLQGYVSLRQDGDTWKDEEGKDQVYCMKQGYYIADVRLRDLAKPRRSRPRGGKPTGCFLERGRLERVLEAMMAGKPLPPVQVEVAPGRPAIVANGFHRYFASLILDFTELPTEILQGATVGGPAARSKAAAKPKWVPASVRRRMEEEEARKQAAKKAARSLRRMEGQTLVRSDLYDAKGHRMKAVREKAKANWVMKVAGKPSSTDPQHRGGDPCGIPAPSLHRCASIPEEEPTDEGLSMDVTPECFGLRLEGAQVCGKFPIRVIRELNGLRQEGQGPDCSFITDMLKKMDAGEAVPLSTYDRCTALLCLSTLDAHGLGAEAPERFGLRRVSFRPKVERFKGSLQPQLLDEIRRLTWSLSLSEADEAFLKTVLHRASKNGPNFFMTRPDFERLLLLRRNLDELLP